jgi:hypothetical protein
MEPAMRRGTMVVLVVLGVLGCGGSDPAPITQVTVTVKQAGVAVASTEVKESADVDGSTRPPTPVGVITTGSTGATGQVTFTVPPSTSTGILCFSSYIPVAGGYSFANDCRSMNALSPTVELLHP